MAEKETKIGRLSSIKELGELGGDVKAQVDWLTTQVYADNNGHDVRGGRKGIQVGIEYAQNMIQDGRFFLVENEEYGHLDFLKEIGMYCVDEHGNPVDAYNHAMDELRYSINHFVKQYMY